MKRVLALFLAVMCLLASLSVLTGCGSSGEGEIEDRGAEIAAYLVGEVYDFDPAKAYTNDDAMKILSLIYEPLFTLDENGKLQFALAKSYRFYDDRGEAKLDIELRNTNWNDGSLVTASDVVYSWKRILDPDFPCQAASLLYEIKYARDAKLCNDKSVDDVAVTDQNQTLTITFEQELDAEGQQNFLRNLTSIALAPVKESAVTRADRDDYWSKRVSYIVTSGPFAIRAMDYTGKDADNYAINQFGFTKGRGHEFRLERNEYYRTTEEAKNSYLYVTPHKFLTYWNTNLDDMFEKFIEGTIFIAGDIPLEQRGVYLNDANVSNMLSTYTYVLDNNSPVFANAKVRRALSLAIDRASLIEEATLGLGVAATGFISHGVLNGNSGSFSEVTSASDYALKVQADMDAAIALVKSAKNDGYASGAEYEADGYTIKILLRDNDEEAAINKIIVDSWKELFRRAGVDVTITAIKKSYTTFSIIEDETPVTLRKDTVQEAFRVHDDDTTAGFDGYNVLAIDYQMLSPDAFSALASFTYELSGNGIHMGGATGETYTRTHVCGFNNDEYNELIEDAYATKDLTVRAEILHEAEKLLLEEMPVIPLIFNQSVSLVNKSLSRVYTSYYGYPVLNRAELRNYHKHLIYEADDIKGRGFHWGTECYFVIPTDKDVATCPSCGGSKVTQIDEKVL